MPRAQRCAAESGVTSSPSNEIVPDEGGSAPAMRLNRVDFPAPFGPIRPTISPRSQLIDTSSLAATPAKCRETLRTSRSDAFFSPRPPAAFAGGKADEALRPDQ